MVLIALMRGVVLISTALVAASAAAQPTTFRIAQVFSDMSGDVQFVELVESAGQDGQHHFAGLTLTSTHRGIVKRFTFARDLPTDRTAHMSIIVSVRDSLPLAGLPTITFDTLPPTMTFNAYEADVPGLPARFIPTDSGTLDFAGIDQISYETLPSDGANALYRDGNVAEAAVPANDRCHVRRLPCEGRQKFTWNDATAIEYYNAALDHYFISASAADIDALDSGRLPGWTRTRVEGGLPVHPRPFSERDHPVCRFYIPPSDGDSHFFSTSVEECEAVRVRFPEFILETQAAFYVQVPNPVTGACPAPDDSQFYAVPVFRLWNQRPDSNHRYTDSERVRDEMVQRGYINEGIVMCYWVSIWDY